MGSYTTTNVTRDGAKLAISKRLLIATDDELEHLVNYLIFDDKLRQTKIVSGEDLNEDESLE